MDHMMPRWNGRNPPEPRIIGLDSRLLLGFRDAASLITLVPENKDNNKLS